MSSLFDWTYFEFYVQNYGHLHNALSSGMWPLLGRLFVYATRLGCTNLTMWRCPYNDVDPSHQQQYGHPKKNCNLIRIYEYNLVYTD